MKIDELIKNFEIEAIKNLDDSIIYLIPTGGAKPLKVIFDNDSDLALDIETANELKSENYK